jgi:HAE1 family hydrophobic/amphiphilic exporter-1
MLKVKKLNCVLKRWNQVRLGDVADVQDTQKLRREVARVNQKTIILQIINLMPTTRSCCK